MSIDTHPLLISHTVDVHYARSIESYGVWVFRHPESRCIVSSCRWFGAYCRINALPLCQVLEFLNWTDTMVNDLWLGWEDACRLLHRKMKYDIGEIGMVDLPTRRVYSYKSGRGMDGRTLRYRQAE